MSASTAAAPYRSGWCGVGSHDRCDGAYDGVACGCACHVPATAPLTVVPPVAGEGAGGTTLTTEDLDQRIAVLAVLAARIKAEDAVLREQRRTTIRPGQRSPVVLPGDDAELAWVSMTKPSGGGRLTADVTDLAALVAWCREHRPSALTQTVRESDQRALCEEAKATGEAIPGITLSETRPSSATLRVNVEDGAFERLLDAVRSGRIDLQQALALGAGGAA